MLCPKCQGEMEDGLILYSNSNKWGGWITVNWATKIGLAGLKAENQKDIKANRCKRCGYLESYAK